MDYFREVTLFKRNPATGSPPQLTPEQRALVRSLPQMSRSFFLSYGNGKSAARVWENLEVESVHEFRVAGERRSMIAQGNPAVLHYPCCGFRHFWQKYVTLGRFGDEWFGRYSIGSVIGTFHTDSRDIVGQGDVEAARRFYRERVVIDDGARVAELLQRGLFLRIEEPARILACS